MHCYSLVGTNNNNNDLPPIKIIRIKYGPGWGSSLPLNFRLACSRLQYGLLLEPPPGRVAICQPQYWAMK